MGLASRVLDPADLAIEEVLWTDRARILEVYGLLTEVYGRGRVEDEKSFMGTVSPETDDAVVPTVVIAVRDERLTGAVVGAFLRNLDMGMVLYSAVQASARGRGVYTRLRGELLHLLDLEARRLPASASWPRSPGLAYVVSELDEDSPLLRRYVDEWGAFVAPIDYFQPAAQGLAERKMDLAFQPVANRSAPSPETVVAVVSEIYARIYRIPDGAQSAVLDRVRRSRSAVDV